MKLIAVLILLSVILLSSCKKETDNHELYHGKISTALYPFLFDTGSYWIYKNSITNSLDSIIVTSIKRDSFMIGPSGPGQGPSGYEECFKINYLKHPALIDSKEELLGYVITKGHIYGGYTYLSSKKKGDASQNATISDILDSLTIEDKTYFSVVKMKITKDYYISNNYNFYYVDSVGIIKKEMTVNDSAIDTWSLVRFKTNMFDY